LPLADEPTAVKKDRLGTAEQVRLEPGDLLYLPRGYTHEAFTSECSSLHLTVGVNVYRWADLLHHALDNLTRQDARFRESVPPEAVTADDAPDGVRERFRELLRHLAGAACPDEACRALGDHFFDRLPALPNARFVSMKGLERVDSDTVVEKVAGGICRVMRHGDEVEIQFAGGRVAGPLKIAGALEFIAKASRFLVRALPDDLSQDAKVVLVRRLIRDGLLTAGAISAHGGKPAGPTPETVPATAPTAARRGNPAVESDNRVLVST